MSLYKFGSVSILVKWDITNFDQYQFLKKYTVQFLYPYQLSDPVQKFVSVSFSKFCTGSLWKYGPIKIFVPYQKLWLIQYKFCTCIVDFKNWYGTYDTDTRYRYNFRRLLLGFLTSSRSPMLRTVCLQGAFWSFFFDGFRKGQFFINRHFF